MEIIIGGGRALTVMLDDSDRMTVEGVMYPDGTSITFYEGGGGNEVSVFFPSRDRMKEFAEKIVQEVSFLETYLET